MTEPENTFRLLVVDDNAVDRQATRRALLQSGLPVQIEETDSVAGALDCLARESYDCALLDFSLPDGDGLAVLREAQSRGISTPLIMLTGQADDLVAAELIKAGAADYLPKSKISPESLARAVQSIRLLYEARRLAAQADVARRASESRFLRVAESNIIGIAFWETDGTITDANDAFLEMLGYSRADMEAGIFNWREMTLPQYHAVDDQHIEELIRTGTCPAWEKELRRKDGGHVAILVSASFLEPPNRKGLAFCVDITARKRAQDAQKFLADASAALSQAPFYRQNLPKIACLAVPAIADCCFFDLIEHGQMERLAFASSNPDNGDNLRECFPPDTDAPDGPGAVVRTGQAELAVTVSEAHRECFGAVGIASHLSVPITVRGQSMGAMTWVHGPSGRHFTPPDLALAEQMAQRIALAIDNARLLFETQARAERESVVNAIGHTLRGSLDANEIIAVAVREIGQALAVSHCLWCWLSPSRDTLAVAAHQFTQPGLAPREDSVTLRGVPPEMMSTWLTSEAITVSDMSRDPQAHLYEASIPAHWNLQAFAACPVRLRGDQQGLLIVQQDGSPRQWTPSEIALLRQVADLLAPALENAQLYAREHRVADMLQAAFLSNIPDEMGGLELATVYHAGLDEAQVGGDCYDAFLLPDGRVALVIADVSGKGLGAAVLTATVKFSLRAFAAEVAAPSLVLSRLNRLLCMDASGMGEHFVTLFYAVFDHANGRLTYASAGHETQIIRRPAGVTLLHANGPILGIAEQAFGQAEEHLEPGDALVLYTDGLTEARNPQTRELLEVERVAALLQSLPAEAGAGAITARLEQEALAWAQGRPHDDVALLAARRLPRTAPLGVRETDTARDEEELFDFTFSSRAAHAADVRQAVSHWMETLDFDRHATQDFLTAVSEAVTNAVRHGSPQGERDYFQIRAFRTQGGAMMVEVRDQGFGMDADLTKSAMPEPDVVSGRGMPLMRACADEVSYVPHPDGLSVRLLKKPPRTR